MSDRAVKELVATACAAGATDAEPSAYSATCVIGFPSDDEDDAPAPPPPAPGSGDRPVRPSSASRPRPTSPPPPAAAAAGEVLDRDFDRPSPARPSREERVGPPPGAGGGPRPPSAPREPTPPPRRYTLEELSSRPRSNPRTRTPMRHASPGVVHTPNRSTVHDGDEEEDAAARVTVRVGAGFAPGTIAGARSRLPSTPERRRPAHQRSARQGPSKRKVRRWNNDRFVGVAAELARSSARGPAAAEAFLRGEAEAHLYLLPNHPLKYRSEFDRLVENKDGRLTDVLERFVRGEVAAPEPSFAHSKTGRSPQPATTEHGDGHSTPADGASRFQRIDPRLRDVLVRACTKERFAAKVVDAFETYLIGSSHADAALKGWEVLMPDPDGRELGGGAEDVLAAVLLSPPASVTSEEGRPENTNAAPATRFRFPDKGSSGGFHRLLLHSVCQFHGLKASSRTALVDGTAVRLLTVTGHVRGGDFRLLDCAAAWSAAEEDFRDSFAAARKGVVSNMEGGSNSAGVVSIIGPLSALQVV